ncbi:CLIP domain-containing serine protease B15-like [Ctenocephalides felis]|uniref:CLIP domain-containing serine protease B15-like n=1 Tax=Ctenocephalides felis TaxID=7515 RepID=UPI000E6E1721|nr:CLIP domain-containing serine protease B15-like [Ctenocephalides felis]XP_026470071.1 CLIP domain-containing serine protease B15-like [Ctenocephalides felis]
MQPGTKANLACKPGFQLHKEPEFTQINCENDGIWDNCLFSCEPECGNPTPIETIFNSDPPVTYLAGQYPWYAMLFTRRKDLRKVQFLFSCGGSIINSRMIITTALCAHKPDIDLDDRRVVVGSSVFRFNKTEDIYDQHYEIEKIIVPKGFDTNHEGRPNDIAIILIKGEFTFSDIIKPICLERLFNGPIEEPEIGEMGYVPGYSTDSQTFDTVRFVYNLSLPYISNTSCGNFEYPFKRYYQSYDKFCAGNLSFGLEIPFGFLGGGYFVPDYKSFEPVYFLKGVASAYGRSVDFFAITNIYVHLPWILLQEVVDKFGSL